MTSPHAKIRFIAIDDNPFDLLFLSEMVKAYPFLENCGTFTNPLEGYEAQQYIQPDLVFLDIEMPAFTGIELLRKFREEVPMAVFITSHPDFALEGFELSALDYVLKPIMEQRFALTVTRIREFWEMKQQSQAYEVLFGHDTMTIKEGHNVVKLAQRDIVYLEAMQDYTKIVTPAKSYLTLSTLSCFMEQLPADRFMRVHRSYAVSLAQVREHRPAELVCGSAVIPIGKTYRSAVSKLKM
ncbi:two component transcriptional regulator, LytTR family [Dyadobacter soli]|uniref:Two component transcriptional regulator, LytTR family n=1 Tax=Dyadobacter soli TaxID=659014 RepID=A0A1G7PU42_9BACT|nr:LytTR family DNA-binding domain-containing protein [Dyadobacter soli]SDF89837.1 two component transcriptional regulator, LytTR family [Dyadobacter soli]